ncbi:MAG: ThiF family adenylyltransferase [Chloroflexota bacterium]|nr:ThiF family adenylyltransferase [Chloroflexota bacterium]
MLPSWWERWPGRLEFELGELERVGVPYERDEAAFQAGVVQLVVHPEVDGERLRLLAVFPHSYPDFRVEVYADDLGLAHHQHPFAKNLCLVGRDTGNWRPSYTLAKVLTEQLPTVLRTGRSGDVAAVEGLEEQQAEPFGDYYPYDYPAILSVDGAWALDPAVQRGELLIGIEEIAPTIRGVVLEVRDDSGQRLVSADEALHRRYPQTHRLTGRWLRVNEPIREADPKRFWETIGRHDPWVTGLRWQHVGRQGIGVVGAVFPDETGWRRTGDGWVFAVRVERGPHYFARTGHVGRQDLAARVPELALLAECKVAVIGLGALGMASALAFARAGVAKIRALDFDIVDPGTSPRWPFGLGAAGLPKTAVLERFLAQRYPYTNVKPYFHRIGAARRHGQPAAGDPDAKVLGEVLDGVDLVYDATAEEGVHPFLNRLCREAGIPYVGVSGTNGAWGGVVVRTRPGAGCWHCFLAELDEGSIPSPTEAPGDRVQPAGCASPTFTGAGFDLEPIALMGVRLAAATLAGAAPGGYPDAGWDVAIGDFRDGEGRPIPPRWQTFRLNKRPGCPACGGR